MTLYFSKSEFNKNASASTKRTLSGHLDVLDGAEVKPEVDGFYTIPTYIIDGDEFYLYPIRREWCTEQKQESLFEQEDNE